MTEAPAAVRLAAHVAAFQSQDIPERVRRRAALNIMDTVASALGGAETANAMQMRQAGRDVFGSGDAPVWFSDQRLHPAAALLANCAAASALDIDDGHRGASGHPGAAIVPAVLQEAISRPRAGRDVLTAAVIGYDVACRVAAARRPEHLTTYSAGRWVGWGVAAALGWMRGCDQNTIVHAMTIAGAEAPENLPAGSYRRMSSVKGGSPWGTLAAVTALARAEAGADGPQDSLDRGDVYDVPAITRDLGNRFEIEHTYLKPYASCRYAHAATDATLLLTAGRSLRESQIDSLTVEVFPKCFTITNERAPQTLEGAQFSIPFVVALACLRGASAFRPMRPESLHDGEVLALAQRVVMKSTAEFEHAFPITTPSRVRLTIRGEEMETTVLNPLGDVANPMSWEAVEQKLRDLGRRRPVDTVNELVAACAALADGRAERLVAELRG